mmetsp:Transcript_35062/g.73964  ORF Transcript_35062/g.73964 Transcript_35062/m.73964 type:complete len:204 (+) Transcript_35062:187-798(+)
MPIGCLLQRPRSAYVHIERSDILLVVVVVHHAIENIKFNSIVVRSIHALIGSIQRQIRHHLQEPSVVRQRHASLQHVRGPPFQIQFATQHPIAEAAHDAIGNSPPFVAGTRHRECVGQVIDDSRGGAFSIGCFRFGNVGGTTTANNAHATHAGAVALGGRLTSRRTLIGSHGIHEVLVGGATDSSDPFEEGHAVIIFFVGCCC